MSMRKSPMEIRDGIERGFSEEAWEDLLEDFNFSGDATENNALAVECTRLLDRLFPGEKFGWQDFDRMLSERLIGRFESAAATGRLLSEEVADIEDPDRRKEKQDCLDAMSDEEMAALVASRPGWYVLESSDRPGTVVMFVGLYSIGDVRR